MEQPQQFMTPTHVLLILVDGLGIPECNLDESVYAACPAIRRLMSKHAVATDPTLNTPGIPQSATGQTAILTGVNAAQLLGRHMSGFPNRELRDIIERGNIFRKLLDRGRSCVFANAYVRARERKLPATLQSVTTVATLAAFDQPLAADALAAGRAVYHDLTHEWLHAHGNADFPVIPESEAATNLARVVRDVDFTLFEYFLTDHAGHRGTPQEQQEVLRSLDRFLSALLALWDTRRDLLLLVSDHGNIEAPDVTRHTRNPVPFCAWGCGAAAARHGVRSIVDVTPRILEILPCTEDSAKCTRVSDAEC